MIDDFKPSPNRNPVSRDSFPRRSGVVLPIGADGKRTIEPLPNTKPSIEALLAKEEQTEEASAGRDNLFGNKPSDTTSVPSDTPATTKKRFVSLRPFSGSRRPNKKQSIVIAAVVLLLGAGGVAFAMTRPDNAPVAKKQPAVAPVPPPAPAPILSPLTGLTVTAEQRDQPVTGVMIENSPDARPQSGLKDAGIVYEAIAEGGITRFMALYQEAAPGNVGPIRSARPYYLDWLLPFEGSLAHVGGSPDALRLIKDLGVRDLDQFANGGSYHRISTRYAPHNVYSDIPTLSNLGKAKGWSKSTFTSFERKAENPYRATTAAPADTKPAPTKPAGTRTSAKAIDFNISSALYNAHYDYKPDTNSYLRSQAGAAHIDFDTKAQLEPKVVVALVMSYGLMADGKHSVYGTTGSGSMFVFQDGVVTSGTWAKPDAKSQFKFTDAGGAPLKLNAGQTWFSIVSDTSKVTSTP